MKLIKDMSLSIHSTLKNWHKIYTSSILLVNKDVPLFEEKFGSNDYNWICRVIKDKKCSKIRNCVIRYEHEKNLSKNINYLTGQWEEIIKSMKDNDDKLGIKMVYQSMGRYYYKSKEFKKAREYFRKSIISYKNIGYYITSYFPKLAEYIVKKFNVFG